VLQCIVRAGQGIGQGGRRFGGAIGIGNFVIAYGTHAKGKRNNDGGQEQDHRQGNCPIAANFG